MTIFTPIKEDPSHTSINSVSELADQFKLVNCAVILTDSAAELAIETEQNLAANAEEQPVMSLEEADAARELLDTLNAVEELVRARNLNFL